MDAASTGNLASFTPSPDTYAVLQEKEHAANEAQKAAFAAVIQPGMRYEGTWEYKDGAGELGLEFLSLRAVTVKVALYDPADPAHRWVYSGSINPSDKRNGDLILQLESSPKKRTMYLRGSTHSIIEGVGHTRMILDKNGDSFEGKWDNGNNITIILSLEKPVANSTPETLPQPPAAPPVAAQSEAPTPQAPVAQPPAPQTPATATVPPPAEKVQPASVSPYPALQAAANGKPQAAVNRVSVDGKEVQLALQVLAPGKTIETVRIDNIDGVLSKWRSDGKESAAPLTVMDGADTLTKGTTAMNLALAEAEKLLTISFTDNGAVSGKETTLRITVFFADKSRVACLLKN